MLRFKIDENLPEEVAGLLRAAGHDVRTVFDQEMVGAPDASIAQVCRQEQRAVVTLDTDFANIQNYPPRAHAGIIVLRLQRQDKAHVLRVLARIVPQLEAEALPGTLWIVDENRIRIRE